MALDRTWYNSLVDDDGSGLTGSIWDKADVNSLMNAIDAELATGAVSGFPWVAYSPVLTSAQGVIFTHGGAHARYQRTGANAKTVRVQFSIEALTFSFNCTEFWISFPFIAEAWAGSQMTSTPLFVGGVYETGYISVISSNTSYALIGRNGGQPFPASSGIYIRGQYIYPMA